MSGATLYPGVIRGGDDREGLSQVAGEWSIPNPDRGQTLSARNAVLIIGGEYIIDLDGKVTANLLMRDGGGRRRQSRYSGAARFTAPRHLRVDFDGGITETFEIVDRKTLRRRTSGLRTEESSIDLKIKRCFGFMPKEFLQPPCPCLVDHLLIVAAPPGGGKSKFIADLKNGTLPATIKRLLPQDCESSENLELFEIVKWALWNLGEDADKQKVSSVTLHFSMMLPLRKGALTFKDPNLLGLLSVAKRATVVNLKAPPQLVAMRLALRNTPKADVVYTTITRPALTLLDALRAALRAIRRKSGYNAKTIRRVELAINRKFASGGIWDTFALLRFYGFDGALEDWWNCWDRFLNSISRSDRPISVVDLNPTYTESLDREYGWQVACVRHTEPNAEKTSRRLSFRALRQQRLSWPVLDRDANEPFYRSRQGFVLTSRQAKPGKKDIR